ncbi:hypothetical protein GCM10020218_063080 [Dactylosporangium vinaceum]
MLAEADEVAAQSILTAVGLADTGEHRAIMRAYCGLAKATAREWLERGALDRERSHAVLATTLTTLVRDIFR